MAGFSEWKPGASGAAAPGAGGGAAKGPVKDLREAVVKGAKDRIVAMIDEELAGGAQPFTLVDDYLIPAITEVGDKYERKEYFLPQLLLSAETMQTAFAHLKPLLEEDAATSAKRKIVMATVEGDIHDIGKNIVILMLENNGFEVIDLGKDVPARRIVDVAREEGASLIGLSALMTTTMVRMQGHRGPGEGGGARRQGDDRRGRGFAGLRRRHWGARLLGGRRGLREAGQAAAAIGRTKANEYRATSGPGGLHSCGGGLADRPRRGPSRPPIPCPR